MFTPPGVDSMGKQALGTQYLTRRRYGGLLGCSRILLKPLSNGRLGENILETDGYYTNGNAILYCTVPLLFTEKEVLFSS